MIHKVACIFELMCRVSLLNTDTFYVITAGIFRANRTMVSDFFSQFAQDAACDARRNVCIKQHNTAHQHKKKYSNVKVDNVYLQMLLYHSQNV